MNKNSEISKARFVVFCLEAYKRHEHLEGVDASDIFLRLGVVDYLTDGYDVLHSLGENALVEDIRDYISRRQPHS